MSFREANAKQCRTPSICCHSVLERDLVLGFRAQDFVFYEFASPNKIQVSEKFMQHGVAHPRYADLVPLCIRDSPGPGIQSSRSGFHLL
jgi:hypothetical protein